MVATKYAKVAARHMVLVRPSVSPELASDQVVKMFHDDPLLTSVAVTDKDNRVLGVLRSLDILRKGTEGYFRELVGRKPCATMMDRNPLLFDEFASVDFMSKAVAQLDDRYLMDGFFVTQNGRYLGAGRMTDLLRAITDQQLQLALHANPLTMLPGNVPIEEKIQGCIESGNDFVVAYFDLDFFKAYNDVYGYHAGDQVIQLMASILRSAQEGSQDFVGHIGGDDFVMVFLADDWESKTIKVLKIFDEKILAHYSSAHIAAGGIVTNNREGIAVHHPLMTVSAGVIRVRANSVDTAAALSVRLVEAKKLAKKMPGSSYFIDRRST